MIMQQDASPSELSFFGQACYQCHKEPSSGAPLQRCSGCSRLYYCSPECQKTHWPKHKQICKAFKIAETTNSLDIFGPFIILYEDLGTGTTEDIQLLNKCIAMSSAVHVHGIQRVMKRLVTPEERFQIVREPRCLACGRSETIFRIENSMPVADNTTVTRPPLEACSDCRLSFYCSPEHRKVAVDRHKNYKAYEGFSQCAVNKMTAEDEQFMRHLKRTTGFHSLCWVPSRTVAKFKSLSGVGWDDFMQYTSSNPTFESHQSTSPRLNIAFRAASETLSLPMTILWALEHIYPDDSWTKKETLNIHILGAENLDHHTGLVFEEILHRVPLIKVLRVTFCGPEFPTESRKYDFETCRECSQKGRKTIHNFPLQTYHDFVAKQGEKYTKPDLAIGLNTGMADRTPESWRKTVNLLIKRKIPSAFTAYNEDEARETAEILRKAGGNLDKYPNLGPMPNPWSSLMLRNEVLHLCGVFVRNRWLSGGFWV